MQQGATQDTRSRKPKGTKPTLVRFGKLGAERTDRSDRSFSKVLHMIMSSDDVALGILHIRGNILQGDIVIAGGHCVLGASTNAGVTGWPAIRALLTLCDAVYQFHDFTNTDIGSLDQGMSLKVQRIIALMPDLPEKMEDLSARVSVNRIRAMDIDELLESRLAEKAVSKYLVREVQKFDDRTMRHRAIILWSFFVLVSLATLLLHHFTF